MGFWHDSTVEVEYNGKVTRVAKEEAHLYQSKKEAKEPKAKEAKK